MESNDVILSCLKLTTPSNCFPHLPTSILDIYKVFEHINMLSIGIQYHPYTVIPTLLSVVLGFWVTYVVKLMSLCHGWGWHPPQTDSQIHITHITCLSTLICCPLAYSSSLTQFYPPYLDQILRFWVTCGVNMMWLCHGWGWQGRIFFRALLTED